MPHADSSGIAASRLAGFALAAGSVTFLCCVVAWAFDLPAALGGNIRSADISTDYLAAVGVAALLSALLMLLPVSPADRYSLQIIWQFKVLTALVIMLGYEAHYATLDSYHYFEAASLDEIDSLGLRIGMGTDNVITLSWLLLHLLPDSFHTLKIAYAMIGLGAIYILYRGCVLFIGHDSRRVLFLLALFPSILFWTSTIGKEPISALGIALFAYGLLGIARGGRWVFVLAAVAGVLVVLHMRIWLGFLIAVPALAMLVASSASLPRKALGVTAIGLAMWGVWGLAVDYFSLESHEDAMTRYDELSRSWAEDGGSGQFIEADLSDPLQYLAFLPWGAFTALFRPLPGEVANLFGWISAIENLALLLLVGVAVLRARPALLREPVVIAGLAFVLAWLALYAPVSYQNLGTAVRFKLQVLPVVLCLAFLFWDSRLASRASGTALRGRAAG